MAESKLRFRDLAVERGYADSKTRTYRFHIENMAGGKITADQIVTPAGKEFEILRLTELAVSDSGKKPDGYGRLPLVRILIQSKRPDGTWALPIEIFVGHSGESKTLTILGWTHAAKS